MTPLLADELNESHVGMLLLVQEYEFTVAVGWNNEAYDAPTWLIITKFIGSKGPGLPWIVKGRASTDEGAWIETLELDHNDLVYVIDITTTQKGTKS